MSKARSTGNIGNIIKTSATCVTVNDGTTDLLIMSGSGTVTIPGNLVVLGGISGSSAESSSYSLSSSFATNANTLDGIDGASFLQTGSFNTFSSSIDTTIKNKLNGDGVISGSVQVDITSTTGYSTFSSSLSSSIGSLSGSVATTTSGLSSSIGSLSSSVATTTSGLASRIGSVETKTGSYATTGSNIFVGSQVITGSLYITNDMVVQGCSCLQNITASAVSIGTNTVVLNTATPAVRFAGISVQDSGSNAGVTGSIYWDGLCNKWIYSNPSTVGYSGGMLISGPRNTGTIGSESPLTCNYIAKSGGGDHIYDSCIIDDGTTTCIKNNIIGIGTACFGGQVCAPSAIFSKAADQVIRVETTSATDNSRIDFITPSKCYTIQNLQTGAANALIFYDLSASAERMRITSTGISCFSSRICAPALTTCYLRMSDELTFGLSMCKGSGGYPIIQSDLGQSIGFYNGEGGGTYAERMRIWQTGIITIGCQVCVPQLTVSNAGGASYNIANYLNTNSTTNSQTYFFMGQSLANGRSGFMDWVDNTDCSNGYVAFGVYGDNPASGTGAGLMIKRGACVGINNNNPLRHLHVGPGSDGPLNPNNGVYISNNGTTALIIRDSTNDSEFTTQVQSSGTILGTLTNHDLIIYTCNAERGRICANGKTRFLACGYGSYIFGNPNVSDDGTFIIGSVVGGTPLSLTDGYNAHTYFRFCSGQSVIESDGTMKFMTAGSINSLILAGTTGIACFSTTNAMIPPVGTTAQRPTASTGMMRYNSTFNLMEFYNGTNWVQMGSGDLATAQCINNTSMCHDVYRASGTLGLQGQGSACISLFGAAAPSMATSNTGNQFATHGGHCGISDYPGYWAVHLGAARAVNQLKVWIHTNSWGYFELQGSNNSGNASGFNQSGTWTTLSFLCSNNGNCQNMGGNTSGCADGTVYNYWFTNDVPFSAYRIKVIDSSRPSQAIGSYYGGSAGYVWQLNRV